MPVLDPLDNAINAVERWFQATARLVRPLYLDKDQRLIRAAEDNSLSKVAALLKSGAAPTAMLETGEAHMSSDSGATALHYAVRNGNLPMVNMLLAAGSCPNAPRRWGETPWWEWLEKHKKHAWANHPLPPDPLPHEESCIGLALLTHGASMQVCIPPWGNSSIAQQVSGPLDRLVVDLQNEVQAEIEAGMLQEQTPRGPGRQSPRRI